MTPVPGGRWDGKRYIDCRWCRGNGCLACEGEAEADYKRAFPDGPHLIATIKIEEIGQLKDVLGPDAMRRYFGPDNYCGSTFERDLKAKLSEIRGEGPA